MHRRCNTQAPSSAGQSLWTGTQVCSLLVLHIKLLTKGTHSTLPTRADQVLQPPPLYSPQRLQELLAPWPDKKTGTSHPIVPAFPISLTRTLGELGSGSFGSVYLARLGPKKLAVKYLTVSLALRVQLDKKLQGLSCAPDVQDVESQGPSRDDLMQFVLEAAVNLDMQSCPLAVAFHGVAQDRRGRFTTALAFEHLAGGSLEARLEAADRCACLLRQQVWL